MKFKISKITAQLVSVCAALLFSSVAFADGAAPGEGIYVGAFIGHGTGVVQAKVNTFATGSGAGNLTGSNETFESKRGGLGLSGIQGGGWLGYGLKTADDIYFGLEMSFAGSDETQGSSKDCRRSVGGSFLILLKSS